MRARVLRFTAAFQTLLLLATLVAPALTAATEIHTDLWIYQDGDTVTVTGIDFGANEVVDFVTTDPVGTVVDMGSATSDEMGAVLYQFVLYATIEGIYDVVATGQSSGLTAMTQFDPAVVTYADLGSTPVVRRDGQTITFSGTFTCENSNPNRCTSATSVNVRIYGSNGGNNLNTAAANLKASFPATTPTFPAAAPQTTVTWSVTKTIGTTLVLADGGYEVSVTLSYLDNAATAQTAGPSNASENTNTGGDEFTIDNSAPNRPAITGTTPASPSSNNSPSVNGTAEAASTVRVYTNSTCTSAIAGSGTATGGAFGIAVSVGSDLATTFWATATDAAGNTSPCSTTSATYVEDSTAPTAPVVTGTTPASPSSNNNPTVDGTAEPGSTIRIYTNSACGSGVAGTGLAAGGSFAVPVAVAANSTTTFYATASDTANNVSACSATSVTYVEDSAGPTVTINKAGSQADPTNQSPVHFTVIFSEPVTNFATGDVTLSGTAGATTAVVTGSGTTYDVEVGGMTGSGTVIATLGAGVASDMVGNLSAASTSTDNNVAYDVTPPTVPTLTDTNPDTPANDNSVDVRGMTSGNANVLLYNNSACLGLPVGNGAANGGGNFTIAQTVADNSTTTWWAAANDALGNTSACSTTSITYVEDSTIPSVTINQAGTQVDPTTVSPVNFTVVFSEPLTNFATGDVTLSGTAGATTATVTGSGTTYNVAVSGMTGPGTVIATIAAGVTSDAAGNNNTTSTSTDNTVNYVTDTTAPVITRTIDGTVGANGWYTSDVTVHWSVTDGQSAVVIDSGCGDQAVTAETTGVVSSCSAHSAGGSTSSSETIKIDKTGPSASLAVTVGTAGSNGWYTSDVTVDTSGADSISGPVVCTADQFQTTETAGHAFIGSCTNDAGLSTNANPLTIKLDKTGPSATVLVTAGTPGANGWFTSNVTVGTNGSDTMSAPVVCTSDQVQTEETAGDVFNGTCTNDAGLMANAAPLTVKVDKTGPSANLSVSIGTAGSNDWYTSDVTIETMGVDSISTAVVCTADQFQTTETTGQPFAGSCTNDAGITTPATGLTIKLDKTGPSAALAVTVGTVGANGWYTSDVTVDTSGTDAISLPVTCSADQFETTETAGQVFNGSCTNDAGLSTNAAPLTIKLDKTGPSSSLAVSAGTLGSNDWYTSDVTVDTAGSDSISNPTTCTVDQFLTSETIGQVFNGSCANDAGLTTNATSLTVKLDKTGPSASLAVSAGTPGDNGWYVSDVTVSTTGSDSISDPTYCSADQDLTIDSTGTTFNGSCTNDAGLETNAVPITVKLDKTAPIVTVTPDRAPDAPPWYNAPVTFDTNGTDATSEIASCDVDVVYSGLDDEDLTVSGECTDNAGNAATGTSAEFDFDDTNPTITFVSRVPVANFFGWANANVLVTWSCSDATSGPVSATVSKQEITEGANQSSTATCYDVANNWSSDTQVGISIDKTDPVISYVGQTPAANGNGWNKATVTLDWTCADGLSGPQAATLSTTLGSEGANQSATATCYDKADNSDANTQSGVNIDLTPPVITYQSRTAANANGWNNGDVTVTWTCFDALSGVVDASVSLTKTGEGAGQSATGTCTDLAGNTASNAQTGINIDKTNPSVTFLSRLPLPNVYLWNNGAVTVTWTCADGLSGPTSATVADTKPSEGAAQTANGTCTDLAGNSSSASLGGINIDLTAPTAVTFGAHGLTEGASYYFGFVPAGPTSCSAGYTISGAMGCVVSGYSTSVGAHTVQAAATDKAGNVGYATIHYTVLNWSISGYYSPVDMGGIVNIVKGGSTVPLKFEVFAGTTELTSVALIAADFTINNISCSTLTGAPNDEIELTTTGGTSFRYDSTGGQFIQNWQTPKVASKCYLVTVGLADGSMRSALFKTK